MAEYQFGNSENNYSQEAERRTGEPVVLHFEGERKPPKKKSKILRNLAVALLIVGISAGSGALGATLAGRGSAAGGRVIAVGTTSCRVLESASDEDGILHEMTDDTGIFIYPGYKFKMTDALITNFHLPESTLLMLVSALWSREKMLDAYKLAVDEGYRFFSFGDAMLIE